MSALEVQTNEERLRESYRIKQLGMSECRQGGTQCNNSAGDSLVLARLMVFANIIALGIVMTSLCMMMIKEVKKFSSSTHIS